MASTSRSSDTRSSTQRLTKRDKDEFTLLLHRILAAIPDDASCFTCTHYRDGLCDMAGGQPVPDEVKAAGCELRVDAVRTVFG
jgi:hypothetical protein